MTEETETDRKMIESADTDADKTAVRDKRAAAESNMKTEKKDRQTVTAAVVEAAAAAAAETNIRIKRVTNFRSRINIRLLTAIQMMLKVLLIFQTDLLCFHADQSDVKQSMFLSHDDIHYYMC